MADAITIKALQDASLDAKSLEEVVNGNEVKQVTTRKGETYPSVKKAITQMFDNGGLPATPFASKALMTASALVDGDYAQVTDDTTNNGLYVKTAGTWVKSDYDPLAQANTYTDGEISSALSFIPRTPSVSLHQWVDKDELIVADLLSDGTFKAIDFEIDSGTLSSVAGKIDGVVAGDYTHIFTDDDDNILAGIKNNGEFETAGAVSSVGIAELRSGVLDSAAMNEVGLRLDDNNLKQAPLKFEVLVSPYLSDDTLHQRMPTAIKLSDNLLYVAFSQFSTAGTDASNGRLVGRFVTYDLQAQTSSASPTQLIDGNKTGSLCRHPILIEAKSKIVLFFNSGTDIVQMESTDRCQTWTNRRIINLAGLRYIVEDGAVQITQGRYAGRVCLAAQYQNTLAVMYSDDECATWQVGEVAYGEVETPYINRFTEVSLALDASQNLIFAIRQELPDASDGKPQVIFARSKDGGRTIQFDGYNPAVPTSSCQMGFNQLAASSFDGVPKIILTHPTFNGGYKSRKRFRVRVSYDNCQSFIASYAPFDDEAIVGYSSVCVLNDSTIALVAEHGQFNEDQSIKINFLNLSEII